MGRSRAGRGFIVRSMATKTVRKHITLPRELAEKFEKLVGPRRQSEEIAAMMERRVIEAERAAFFREKAGAGSADDYPHWATDEDVAEWVREQRRDRSERPEIRRWQGEQQRGDAPR